MNTTATKKYSRCRKGDQSASPSKRKALHRRGLKSLRCWQHITRCFSVFQRRKLSAFSMFRSLRQGFGTAALALLLPAVAKADNFVVTTNSDTTDGGDGELTLREAITLANSSAGPDTVGFVSGLSGDVLVLTQGELVVSEDLSIDASNLAQAPTIDADQNSRIINFTAASGELEITKLVLRNGKVTGYSAAGGGIRAVGGDITLTNSTLSGNSVSGYYANGGAIVNAYGAVALFNSTLSENSANGEYAYGGGIWTNSGEITLSNSTLSANSASGGSYSRGGGIASNTGTVTLTDSTLAGNSVSGADNASGGGIASNTGTVTLTDSTLAGNSVSGADNASGGGIHGGSGILMLTNSNLNGNSVSGADNASGGGIFSSTGAVTLIDSNLSGNSVNTTSSSIYSHEASGGGIETIGGAVTLTNSTLSGNSATSDDSARGGGINSGFADVTLTNSTLSGNSANGHIARGGGINILDGTYATSTVTIINSTLSGNSANGEGARGGGIAAAAGYRSVCAVNVANSTLSQNSASGEFADGGGIWAAASAFQFAGVTLDLSNSIIAGNSDNGSAPDVRTAPDYANESDISHCLIGDSTGARLDEAAVNLNNLTDTDPLLGPLADNGGDTKTQLPFPGSPAINAGGGSPPLQDQRGFDRVGLPDIGAVEYQGSSDLGRIFESDHDGDGNTYGIEQALGTDPIVSDASNPRNLTAPTFNSSGHPVLSFGIADDAAPGTLWILERSNNLGGFVEIFRFDGSTQTIGGAFTLDVQTTATGVIITDEDPPSGGAFYRFKTILPDPG